MRSTMKRLLAIAAGASMVVSLAACGQEQPNTDGEAPIVIGMVEDSTGPGASYATIVGETVRDLVDKINADGGVKGHQLQLVVESDDSDGTQTPTVVRRMVDQGAVAVVFATGATGNITAKPVLTETKTVGIAPVALNPDVASEPDAEFSYMLPNPVSDQSAALAGGLQAVGAKSVAIFHDATAGLEALAGSYKTALEKLGLTVVGMEKAPVDAADVSAQAARLADAKPDAILVVSIGGQLEAQFHNAASQALPGVPRFSLASIGNQPDTWKLARPNVLDDVVYLASVSRDNPRTVEVETWLKSVRGADYTVNAYDLQGYDAVMLIVDALENAASLDNRDDLNAAMNAISGYKSSFGQSGFTLSFNESKHIGADGLCGIILASFKDNKPAGDWSVFQPPC